MKAIHKYRLEASDRATRLQLKEGYRVVRFEYLVAEKGLFMWVEEPLRADVGMCEASFKVAMTGKPVAMDYEYMDTALDPFGPEAYHLFRIESEQYLEPAPQPKWVHHAA